MRNQHTGCPRSRMLSTRRQVIHGFGAVLGGAVTGCASPHAPGTLAASGGAGGLGTAQGGAGRGPGGSGGAPGVAGMDRGGAGFGGAPGVRKSASDRVMLGTTGIEISRLALGSGTNGSGGGSAQTRLGARFRDLLTYGFSQGITVFETADSYGAHPLVAQAIKEVGRNNVVVLTKTTAETRAGVEADLARFREELGVDVIDIVLLHNKQSGTWTTECEGGMEALERAKQSGAIRAHGVSCHTLAALELAATTDWVDVDLARINPAGVIMDSDPATVISVLTRMKAAGKGMLGMKILGEGRLANQLELAISHAVALDCIDGFSIGFQSVAELDQVTARIAAS